MSPPCIASHIPGSVFVSLEGKNHLILDQDECWPRFKEAVGDFLTA